MHHEVNRVSDKGRFQIAVEEGICLSPYYDTEGHLTIGLGHTATAGGIDPANMWGGYNAEERLDVLIDQFVDDLKRFRERVLDAVDVPLEQHELDALTSFDFNTGGIYKARLTEYLNKGMRLEAGDAFMGWSKPVAIIPRRRAEQKLFRHGDYKGGRIAVYLADENGNRATTPTYSIGFAEFEELVNNARWGDPDVDGSVKADPRIVGLPPAPPKSNAGPLAAAAAAIAAIIAAASGWLCELPLISSMCGG